MKNEMQALLIEQHSQAEAFMRSFNPETRRFERRSFNEVAAQFPNCLVDAESASVGWGFGLWVNGEDGLPKVIRQQWDTTG